jgi:hypothetical protein
MGSVAVSDSSHRTDAPTEVGRTPASTRNPAPSNPHPLQYPGSSYDQLVQLLTRIVLDGGGDLCRPAEAL